MRPRFEPTGAADRGAAAEGRQGRSGTSRATCARRSAALEVTLDGDGRHRIDPRQRGRPAVARPHLPQGVRARRTCTTTPTGCAGPVAPDRRRRVAGDRLGRGARPRRPTGWPPCSTSTAATRSRSTSATPTSTASAPLTHGPTLVRLLRTRNRFSATSVDQLPAPARGLAALRPPAPAARPRHRPHVVLPGPRRRQPDGLQRLADDRARLPAAGCASSRRAAAGWWSRPAAHRDGQGRRRAPLRPARAPTPSSCWRCVRTLFAEGLARPPAYVDGRRRRARARSSRSRPSSPRQVSGIAGRRRPRAWRGSSPRPTAARSTGGWGSRRRRSASSASGRSRCSTSSPATSTGRAA